MAWSSAAASSHLETLTSWLFDEGRAFTATYAARELLLGAGAAQA
jgi:hypothetical protein